MRLWMPEIAEMGEEVRYELDLPGCCQRDAHGSESTFECVVCGARWQEAPTTELEECAFTRRPPEERRGAA